MLYILANRELIAGVGRDRSGRQSHLFQGREETSIGGSGPDLCLAKSNRPRRSRAGRELTLAMPTSVAYSMVYSCAPSIYHAPKSAIILDERNRLPPYIYI